MHIVAGTQPQGPMHLHSVADNLLEALAVVACTAPRLFHQLQAWLGGTEEAQGQLLDRWVAIASTRLVLVCCPCTSCCSKLQLVRQNPFIVFIIFTSWAAT